MRGSTVSINFEPKIEQITPMLSNGRDHIEITNVTDSHNCPSEGDIKEISPL